MIETDEQRRWWFATHPEYSWSRTGAKNRGKPKEEKDPNKLSPEEVDAYVDHALKHVHGTVADLLKAVKRHFGTAGEAQKGGDNRHAHEWDTEAGGRIGRGGRKPPGKGAGGKGRQKGTIKDWLKLPESLKEAMRTVEAELLKAGLDPKKYRITWFKGRYVAQRDSTFDPNQKDVTGRTNKQITRQGNNPFDRNGEYVILHHSNQRKDGPMIEMTTAEHSRIQRRYDASQINRDEFKVFRRAYWRHRGESLPGQ